MLGIRFTREYSCNEYVTIMKLQPGICQFTVLGFGVNTLPYVGTMVYRHDFPSTNSIRVLSGEQRETGFSFIRSLIIITMA